MTHTFDAIIVGTGQAGPSLAQRLTSAGMKTAIVERGKFGGTCVNTGCIPTKAMVASAYVAHLARRAAEFGVTIPGPVTVDMKQVKARKDQISGVSNTGVEGWLKAMDRCTVFEGHARFESPRELSVGGQRLSADRIFLNVGARPAVPNLPGLDTVPYLTSSTMMDVDFLPPHLVILGGSYIGLEFGQMFRRFGSEVTIVERGPRLIPREDPDISAAILDILQSEGITIHLNAPADSVALHGDDVVLQTDRLAIRGSHLLCAIGRRPNTDDLGLDKAGIETDKRGYIVVDDQLQTSQPGIWALGDCNGNGAFTHTSYNDFEIVAANLLDKGQRRLSDRIPAYGLYIDPPLGRAGMTEAEVRATGRPALIAHRPMTRVGRAFEKSETLGFMKVIVDKETRQILGAALLGLSGDEVVHSILDMMYAKQPYEVIQHAMHIHPTVSELVPTLLGDLKDFH